MPGYTLVDLFTSYRFDSGFEIGATVVNLFDTDYTPAYHADCSVWSRDTDKLLRQQSFKLQRLWSGPDVAVDHQGTILADRLQAAGIRTCKIGDKESTNVAVNPMTPGANSGAAGPSVL